MIKSLKTISFAINVRKRVFNKQSIQKKDSIWFRDNLQKMGPTYIKIGQFMSNRRDIFDKEIVNELKSLQDDVVQIDENIIEDYIKNNINLFHFEKISKKPVASASIGQVHKAYLINKTKCVIKFKKPLVVEQISEDLNILMN